MTANRTSRLLVPLLTVNVSVPFALHVEGVVVGVATESGCAISAVDSKQKAPTNAKKGSEIRISDEVDGFHTAACMQVLATIHK